MFPRRRSVYFATYLVFAVALLLFGLLWLAQSPPTVHAQSQPEALGSLSGIVRNEQGDPLPNITVWLSYSTNLYESRSVATDGGGNYLFQSVLPGTYNLRFEDPQEHYAPLYYQNAHFADDAQTVVVSGNDVTGIDMELKAGGAISVTLQSPPGLTITYATLNLYRQTAAGNWMLYKSASLSPVEQDARLDTLASGTYRLCAEANLSLNYTSILECYDNVLPENFGLLPPDATDILVQNGAKTTITMTLNPVAQVEGYVLGANDEPLANMHVLAANFEGLGDRVITTDDTGYFRFGYIPSGNYRLLFNPPYYSYGEYSGYLPRFYPALSATPEADHISIGPETHISITTNLTPEARIIGKVTLPNDVPMGYNGTVQAIRQKPDGSWFSPEECLNFCPQFSWDPIMGMFTLSRMEAGRYRIRAQQYVANSQNYVTGFYGGTTFESASDIVLTAGDVVTGINIIVGETAFDGAIMGVVTANGENYEGAEVGLFPLYPDSSASEMPIVFTTTDEDGEYRLEGLPAGAYRIGVRDPAGTYATTFYANSRDPLNPQAITVAEGATKSGIDVDLSPGGTIRGRIRTAEGKQPGGFEITLLQSTDDFYGTVPLAYTIAQSDASGTYELTGVPPGTYRVFAVSPEGSPDYTYPLSRYYPGEYDLTFAETIQVRAGQARSGIDIYFTHPPSSFLPFAGSE